MDECLKIDVKQTAVVYFWHFFRDEKILRRCFRLLINWAYLIVFERSWSWELRDVDYIPIFLSLIHLLCHQFPCSGVNPVSAKKVAFTYSPYESRQFTHSHHLSISQPVSIPSSDDPATNLSSYYSRFRISQKSIQIKYTVIKLSLVGNLPYSIITHYQSQTTA